MRVLILGGTTEARELATRCAGTAGLEPITSLAGAVAAPRLPAGDVRIGGFGGAERLARYLREAAIAAVVDATHPFAAVITTSALTAARVADVPLVVLRRPGWTRRPGDTWWPVDSLAGAAALLPALGERVLLTTGRRSLAAFADVDRCWFLSRSVDPPTAGEGLRVPRRLTVLLGRGPFTIDAERALLAEHRIDVLVTKDSGGGAAKLTAARERGIPVVLVDRPPVPSGAQVVATVAEAHAWLLAR